ncbi:hypothetical protein ACES2I_06115 [Bdellovibrio bacteriovorus]|uniref:hypothetical protein n=1 Tax=Bdellovibrio bacteriovorus TaxID=959 RepID=UPI0035A69E4F
MKKMVFALTMIFGLNSHAARMLVVNQTNDAVLAGVDYFDINAGHVVETPDFGVPARQSQSRDIGSHEADKRYFAMWQVKSVNGQIFCQGDQSYIFANETLEVKVSGSPASGEVYCKSNR